MHPSDGYAETAALIYTQLPEHMQKEIEFVREHRLPLFITQRTVQMTNNSVTPHKDRKEFPPIYVALTFYFQLSDNKPIICDIEFLNGKP